MTDQTTESFTLTMPTEREIVITRVFEAPRKLVFEAITRPEHIRCWWGPRAMTMVVCDIDFRQGGAYRFVLRGPDGNDYAFRGVYHEILPPERVVNTFEFEGLPGHVSVETLTLVEEGGKTRLISTSVYASAADRDGHVASGMESGARESYDRLAELLATLS